MLLLICGREGQITSEGKDPDNLKDIWMLEVDTARFHGAYHEEIVDYAKTGKFMYIKD